MLQNSETYYELLQIEPDATPDEIRAAYLRAKAAFRRDSVALYSLMSEPETTELLREIEKAFQTLSNPEKRRDYDRDFGASSGPLPGAGGTPLASVVSIDRVPPMEDPDESDILVPPSTDFSLAPQRDAQSSPFHDDVAPSEPPAASATPAAHAPPMQAAQPQPAGAKKISSELQAEIESETEWKGSLLRRIREARNVPLEELSDYTKIGKNYLIAIEDENFAKLPAAVFLRGFLTQIAKYLKLPPERVLAGYLPRFNVFNDDKEKNRGR